MEIFCTFSPTSNHLHPLQVENCDNNSRLVVDEGDNGKFRLERVKGSRVKGSRVKGSRVKVTINDNPENTGDGANVGLILAHRLRRWSNFKPTLSLFFEK